MSAVAALEAHGTAPGKLYGVYLAKVTSVKDDKKQGRIQLKLLAFDGVTEQDAPIWARVAVSFAGNNYGALLTRVRAVAAQDAVGVVPEQTFTRWVVDGAGNATLGGITRDRAPDEPAETRVLRIDGVSRTLRGWWTPFDHAGGGFFHVERK